MPKLHLHIPVMRSEDLISEVFKLRQLSEGPCGAVKNGPAVYMAQREIVVQFAQLQNQVRGVCGAFDLGPDDRQLTGRDLLL